MVKLMSTLMALPIHCNNSRLSSCEWLNVSCSDMEVFIESEAAIKL